MLQVSRTWLYGAAKDGRIPSVRLGRPEGPVRFVEEDIERWLERARQAWRPGGEQRPNAPASAPGRVVGQAAASQIARSVSLAAASAKLCSRWP
jgi:excisionase family DNA binding protein